MGNGNWFRLGGRRAKGGVKQGGGSSKRKGWLSSAANRCALSFESLEDRRMLATFMVTTTADLSNGAVTFGSLRWAIGQANANGDSDTIVFAQSLFSTGEGQTVISLNPGQNGGALKIEQPVRILGPGARKLAVSQGAANARVFNLEIGDEAEIFNVEISGMEITSGSVFGMGEAFKGGGVYNREALTMNEVILSNNSASAGGGAVFTEFGRLTLNRSLVIDNSGGGRLDTGDGSGGGAILNGRTEVENAPTTTIVNSTFTRNNGAAIKNRNGTVTVLHSTITENDYGIVSWGNPVPEEEGGDPPAKTVFTEVYSSIVWGNEEADVERVGEKDGDPPVPLLQSVTSLGFNIVGTGNTTMPGEPGGGDPPAPPEPAVFKAPMDQIIADDVQVFAFDEDTMLPLGLDDFGGSTDVFMLNEAGPAIDKGGDALNGNYEQRGRHFTRTFGLLDPEMPLTDVGAVEVQTGFFLVDTLVDETDGVYNEIYKVEFVAGVPDFTIKSYESLGDFSLREAIQFAMKNPGLDDVLFSVTLNTQEILEDEDLTPSPAPTISLSLGSLSIAEDLNIIGPEGFILEIDAVGNDVNPLVQNGTGTRVFDINDGVTGAYSDVFISNLTIMGGDVIGQGSGIRTRENLTLSRVTLKNNNATDDGGGLHAFGGATVVVDRSTLRNNRAGDNGAGISLVGDAQLTLTNSTLSANIAGNRGGGLAVDGSDAVVEFSTITLNTASSTVGSGILTLGAAPTASVKSSIVSGNTSNDISFFGTGNSAANFTSGGWNFIGRGNALSQFTSNDVTFNTAGAAATDPKLEPIANTGGLIETHQPIYRPAQGIISPVIDMGNPTAEAGLGGVPDYDQRGPGFVRVFNALGGATARIDIGAYELQGSTFLVSSFFDENDGIQSAGNLSLREAVQLANQNPLPDIIEFDATTFDGVENPRIRLSDALLAPGTPADIRITSSVVFNWTFDEPLTIDGFRLDNPSLTIDGSRMFTVDDGNLASRANVEFNGGTGGILFANARAPEGGGVFYSRENLTFSDVTFINNVTIETDEAAGGFPPIDQTGLHGGAIFQDGTGQAVRPLLTLNRVLMTGNLTLDADADGGAVYVLNAEATFNDSTITGNSTGVANSEGGGIALKNSVFTSNFTTITGNQTLAGSADGGGLYFSDGSVVTLNDTVVSGNDTVGPNSEGGGLAGVGSTLSVVRSIISDNTTIGSGASGGGIALIGGVATIDVSSVRNNSVSGNTTHGAGIWNNGAALTVRGSTIVGNTASHAQSKGGGVYSDTDLAGAPTTILNSTVSSNSATLRGGGVFNADGRLDILHSTIANNATSLNGAGAGVASQGNGATQTQIGHSIVAQNVGVTAGQRTDLDVVDGGTNSLQSLGYNVIGTGAATAIFTQTGDQKGVLDAGLAPLADNGAPAGMVYELLTHSLLATSVAINGGSPSFNPFVYSPALSEDQHGADRVLKGRIDVGAYESNFAPPGFADFDGDSDVDGVDFLTWQRNLGRTSATLAQGDANGDGTVNGADLAEWRDSFGPASAVSAAAASSGGAAFASAGVQSAPAESDQRTFGGGFGSLASLGVPSSSAPSATTAKASDAQETFAAAAEASSAPALAWESADGDSLLDDEDDFASLVAATVDGSEGAAEDAVFASWGVGRLF